MLEIDWCFGFNGDCWLEAFFFTQRFHLIVFKLCYYAAFKSSVWALSFLMSQIQILKEEEIRTIKCMLIDIKSNHLFVVHPWFLLTLLILSFWTWCNQQFHLFIIQVPQHLLNEVLPHSAQSWFTGDPSKWQRWSPGFFFYIDFNNFSSKTVCRLSKKLELQLDCCLQVQTCNIY